ncbi:MAG: hypothetical protein JO219_00280 [Candidatus Eremiobacteraeota bacterium]|nr:hypothetical protein [Candidatus Eremiobacteraeota bacterium]
MPLIMAGDGPGPLRAGGRLCDVAPTILALMQLPQPPEMSCKSLLP